MEQAITLGQVCSVTTAKNLSYIGVFVASAMYLGINIESVAILTGLILMDVVTGIGKSAVVYGPNSIKSYRLISGLMAKLLLLLIPMALAFAGKGIGVDLATLAQASITVLILAQAYSVIGNVHAMQTKKEKDEFDAVAYILRELRNIIERVIVQENRSNKDPK